MIDLKDIKEVFLFTGTTDFRLGVNGLTAKVVSEFPSRDLNKMLFVFCSKDKKGLKILEFGKSSTWIHFKRLDHGRLLYPSSGENTSITLSDLYILINGMELVYKVENKQILNYDYY